MKFFSRDEQLCNFNIHYEVYHSFEYFCECMESLGIKNVELIAGHHSIPMDHKGIGDLSKVKDSLKRHGLRVRSVSAESCGLQYQYAAKDKEQNRRSFEFFSNGLRLCAELGSPLLQANAGWGLWNEAPIEGQKRAVEMFGRLCEVADQLGVDIACESLRPQESLSSYRLDQIKYIFDQVDHKRFKAMLDLCAMGISGESVQDWFDAFGSENIIHTHFQDGTPYYHLIWGEGKRSLENDLRQLYNNGYKGMVSQEITLGKYMTAPFEYDKKNFEALGEYFY